MRPNVKIYKHIPLEREMMKLSYTSWRWKDEGISWWRPWRKDFREKWVWKEKREVERILEKRENGKVKVMSK